MPGTKLANVSQIRRELLRLYRDAEAGGCRPVRRMCSRKSTAGELKALPADRAVRHANEVASIIKILHQTEEWRWRLIQLAIKASELAEVS